MEFETAKKFIDLILDNNEATAQYIDALKRDVEERIGGKLYSHGDFTKLANEIFEEFVSTTCPIRISSPIVQMDALII